MPVELTDSFHLEGDEIQFAEAPTLKERGAAMILAALDSGQDDQPITVDLGGLEHANSLTVALLLHWYRTAHMHERPIVFVNLSQDLRNIVTFSGLSDVLLKAGGEQHAG